MFGAYNCKIKSDNYVSIFSTAKNVRNYTAPSMVLECSVSGMEYEYNKISIYKMLALSVVYIIVGYMIFKKKKMEYAGESFENKYVHLVVKGLTLVPFAMILVPVVDAHEWEVLAFAIAIIAVYYLIYDLVTNKKNKILVNLCAMLTALLVLFGVYSTIKNIGEEIDISIDVNDIETIVLEDIESKFSGLNVEVKDKALIRKIINKADYRGQNRKSIDCVLKLSNGSMKNFSTYLGEDIVEKVLNEASAEEFKTVNIKYNLQKKLDKAASKKLKNALDKAAKENGISYLYKKALGDGRCIYAYEYKNHKVRKISYPITISKEVFEIITKAENESAVERIESYDQAYIYFYVEKSDINNSDTDNFDVSYYGNCPQEIRKFILENNKVCDMDKDYVVLHLAGECFYTNEIEAVESIMKNLGKTSEYYEDLEKYSDDYYEIDEFQNVETMSI